MGPGEQAALLQVLGRKSQEGLRRPIVEKVAQVAESVTGKLKNTATELMDMPGKIAKAVSTADDERPVNVFLGMAFQGERHLVEAFKQVAQQHMAEPDIHATCRLMASWSQEQAEGLKPFIAAYHKDWSKDPEGSVKSLFEGLRSGDSGYCAICMICGWRRTKFTSTTRRSSKRPRRCTIRPS